MRRSAGDRLRSTYCKPFFNAERLVQDHEGARINAEQRGYDGSVVDRVVELHLDLKRRKTERYHMEEVRNRVAKTRSVREEDQRVIQGSGKDLRDFRVVGKRIKKMLQRMKEEEHQVETELLHSATKLPNWTHTDVPIGDESNARIVDVVGSKQIFPDGFEPLHHADLGEKYGWFDHESGSNVAKARFTYLSGEMAALEHALVSWTLSRLAHNKFHLVSPPDIISTELVKRCGFLPAGEEISDDSKHVFRVSGSDLCLSGTAEMSLIPMYMDKIIAEDKLPIRVAALSHCFRPEAGHHGAAVRGIYRLHQFTKVEMVSLCMPEDSDRMHAELLATEQALFTELGLHYRVLDMPTEELGGPAFRKYDIEAWMPGRNCYGEISSTSNCTDYQSQRLNIRVKQQGEQRVFVHTLNGTACAIPRMIVSIIEQFQQPDGTVILPPCLHPFYRMYRPGSCSSDGIVLQSTPNT